jgi:mRNA interferase HigB
MHIITRKRLNDFAESHSARKAALQHWYSWVKKKDFTSFADLRATFPSADQVGKLTVFNLGGNKIRLVAAVHYNHHKIYIRAILTHCEYDEEKWKE